MQLPLGHVMVDARSRGRGVTAAEGNVVVEISVANLESEASVTKVSSAHLTLTSDGGLAGVSVTG